MVIEIATAALLGCITTKLYQGSPMSKKRLAVRKISLDKGEVVYDIAFEGDWGALDDRGFRKLAELIKAGIEHLGKGAYVSAGSEKTALELVRQLSPLKRAYEDMMAKRPADYDPEQDPPEVNAFFRAVRSAILLAP